MRHVGLDQLPARVTSAEKSAYGIGFQFQEREIQGDYNCRESHEPVSDGICAFEAENRYGDNQDKAVADKSVNGGIGQRIK